MAKEKEHQTGYGNWVPVKVLYSISAISFVLLILTLVAGYFLKPVFALPVALVFLFFLLTFIYFSYAHRAFSEKGLNLQDKVHGLIFEYIQFGGDGKILDIGCGNGKMLIRLAREYPDTVLDGIDYWGGVWEQCKERGCGRQDYLQAGKRFLPAV